jgi:rRNA maturation endonuclease Nob1
VVINKRTSEAAQKSGQYRCDKCGARFDEPETGVCSDCGGAIEDGECAFCGDFDAAHA